MNRIKTKLPSWEDGRNFMSKVSEIMNHPIEEDGSYLYCKTSTIQVSCHFHPKGISYILIKTEETLQELIELVDSYK